MRRHVGSDTVMTGCTYRGLSQFACATVPRVFRLVAGLGGRVAAIIRFFRFPLYLTLRRRKVLFSPVAHRLYAD